jgi:hypothetical protein
MRRILVIVCVWCGSVSTYSNAHPRSVTITGRAVAYSSNMVCLNGNGYWSEVIRIQHPVNSDSRFIEFNFSLPCGQSPIWFSTEPAVKKFHLFREKDCDAVLSGSLNGDASLDRALPVWTYFPGAEQKTLPFGHTLACYGSIDHPMAPVL